MASRPLKHFLILFFAVLGLVACEGGDDDGGFVANTDLSGLDPVAQEIRLGSVVDLEFQEGLLAIQDDQLSQDDVTKVSVEIFADDDALAGLDVMVSFTSVCVELGTATLSATDVVIANNKAEVEYTLGQGCLGDTISASSTIGDINYTAVGFITVPQDPVNSIQFVSAVPATISIAGSGGIETADITFVVLDGDGAAVSDRLVTFSLDNSPGGATLSKNSNTSDENGQVTTTIRAGTVLATLVVTASVAGVDAITTSSGIAVSTGLPDQGRFGLAASNLNVDAYHYVGNTSTLTARLNDIFGNPVPDDTKVTFTTEGGSVLPSCLTLTGACSVTWTGTLPYADTVEGDTAVSDILAVAIGNESFIDENGNGQYEDGETFTDLGEPYRDDNNSGAYDIGEYFFDHNNNALRDEGDGIYNGVLCNSEQASCDKSAVAISATTRITMSNGDATPLVSAISPSTLPSQITANTELLISITDSNGNALPVGTVIEATSSAGTIVSDVTETVGSTGSATDFYVNLEFDPASGEDASGSLRIKVSLPRVAHTVVSIPILVPFIDDVVEEPLEEDPVEEVLP